ncbi:MAG: hypothetical protein JWO42_666 [Chloroflexi bacterium]|jgi:hypothetical protein|nr:hypothetical protein [Chloroflexota bacterium]
MPSLDFAMVDADVLPYAAGPTLLFKLQIMNAEPEEQIHSILLRAQIRIEASQRHYDAQSEDRLLDLFGEPGRWGQTLRSLLWTHATIAVPRFAGSTIAELPIACTYDFELVAAKYFHALEDGEVPLQFLFSGTVFYTSEQEEGLRITQIPWEKETSYRMPIRLWKEMMDQYFPNSAWLRLRRDVFDRLYSYKARSTLPTWEAAVEQLLNARETDLERRAWNQ